MKPGSWEQKVKSNYKVLQGSNHARKDICDEEMSELHQSKGRDCNVVESYEKGFPSWAKKYMAWHENCEDQAEHEDKSEDRDRVVKNVDVLED